MTFVPFVKTVRSGARDADGNLPPEVWAEQSVAPTLNAMDNGSESRATVVSVHLTQDPITSTEVTPALSARSASGAATVGVATGMAVRRLTPTECERLQGFPDGWTAAGGDGRLIADSARYRMLGNAVAVPVAEWIGRRMVAHG